MTELKRTRASGLGSEAAGHIPSCRTATPPSHLASLTRRCRSRSPREGAPLPPGQRPAAEHHQRGELAGQQAGGGVPTSWMHQTGCSGQTTLPTHPDPGGAAHTPRSPPPSQRQRCRVACISEWLLFRSRGSGQKLSRDWRAGALSCVRLALWGHTPLGSF